MVVANGKMSLSNMGLMFSGVKQVGVNRGHGLGSGRGCRFCPGLAWPEHGCCPLRLLHGH